MLKAEMNVEDDLLDLYLLLAFTKGIDTELIDVHDAWAIWRNKTAPEHRSLVPFNQLTQEVQELDRPYCESIQKVAARFL